MKPFRTPDPAARDDRHAREVADLKADRDRWRAAAEAKRDPAWPFTLCAIWAFVGAGMASAGPWRALEFAGLAVAARIAGAAIVALARRWR